MELLKEIHTAPPSDIAYKIRKCARAVLFHEGKVALLYVSTKKYHKLPGGGVDEGETIEEALEREILEETGCAMKRGKDIGLIIEFRDNQKKIQISYTFFAEVTEVKHPPKFEPCEIEQGLELEWHTLDEAITLLENENPEWKRAKIHLERDLTFLKKAKALLEKKAE